MSVRLTSPVLGRPVGFVYTGPEEEWLLAQGYAKRESGTSPTSYTGPGVAGTGPTDVAPAKDPQLASNREPAQTGFDDQHRPNPEPVPYDFDTGGVNDDVPSDFTVEPAEVPLAGGAVTLKGRNFGRSTGVTFGGDAGTGFQLVNDTTIRVTAPAAEEAGEVDVVVLNPAGNKTMNDALAYAEAGA